MMKKQNWWDQYPDIEPLPAPLPGPGSFDSYSSAGKAGAGQFQGLTPDQAAPTGYGQPYPADGKNGPGWTAPRRCSTRPPQFRAAPIRTPSARV